MRKTCAIVFLALLASLFTAVPAANAYRASDGATFNAPRPFGNDAQRYAIVRAAERAIRNVPRKVQGQEAPVILISTFLLDRKASVDALVNACRRGVSVRVILDQDIKNKNQRRLIRVLNGDNVVDTDRDGKPDRPAKTGRCGRPLRDKNGNARPTLNGPGDWVQRDYRNSLAAPQTDSITWGKDKSYIKQCDGACRGAGGNMHSKFYVFSATGSSKFVSMVSSSNLNRGGALLGWNDMYTMANRRKLYDAFVAIHRQMTDDKRAGVDKVQVTDGPYTVRFFPMRNAGKGRDPVLRDLNKVACRGPLGRTQLYVSMFYWKGSRGNYLADKLLSLARSGCQVNVIYGAPSLQIAERLRLAATRYQINLYDSRWDFNDDGFNEVRTHGKYVLVRGSWGAQARAFQVWTGSANWVAGSLRKGDEVSLNISGRSAYTQYLRDWQRVRAHSRRLPYKYYG